MAGTSYFNAGSVGGNGDSPFYKLKPIPLINRTNIPKVSNYSSFAYTNLPVWRSAVANNYFQFDSIFSQVTLFSVNAAGTSSTLGTSTFTSYLTSSNAVAVHLNTTDQCLYVLLYESPQYRLIKVSDAAGTTTAIGSAFTPTTASRWPTHLKDDPATMLDDGTGSIKVMFRGYTHQINKTTGAIVTQDVAVTIGSYSLVNTFYMSLDNAVAVSPIQDTGVGGSSSVLKIPNLVTVDCGQLFDLRLVSERVTERLVDNSFDTLLLVDNDKIFVGKVDGSSGSGQNIFGYVYRSDFDQFLRSVADWSVGA